METMELVGLMEWTTSLQNKTAIRYGKMLSFCDICILRYLSRRPFDSLGTRGATPRPTLIVYPYASLD